MKRLLIVLVTLMLASGLSVAQNGVKKKRTAPQDYGQVIINHYSGQAQPAPVVFDHWLHRAKYTCRLCHVDIGFAMKANETGIKAADNNNGQFCGACHNGKATYGGEKIFNACSVNTSPQDAQRCIRCHSQGKNVKSRYDFATVTGKFPKGHFGNGVDWIAAEAAGLIKLTDSLETISGKGKRFQIPPDMDLAPTAKGIPEIAFSHDKHSVWNGCELCHPEVFPSVKKGGALKYSMNEIFDGKYCGACHGRVAFPVTDCQKCHSKPASS